MPWTTDDRSRFLDALLSAYNVAGFATMLKLTNDRELADLAPPSAPRKQAFLDVITAAEQGGWIDRLVRGAHRDQPDNADMMAFFRDYERRAPRTSPGGLFHGLATEPQPRELRVPRPAGDVASASPIVIAVEETDHPIPYTDLLPVERHVTVKLSSDDVRRLHDIGRADRPPHDALARLADDGVEVWRILRGRQRRLEAVFERAGAAAQPQPIAWTGSGELLAKIHAAVLIARLGRSEDLRDLLSIGAGDHYFNPLAPPGSHRNLPRRVSTGELDAPRPLVRSVDDAAVDAIQAAVAAAAMSPVVVVGSPSQGAAMSALSRAIAGASSHLCRIAVGLGDAGAGLDALHDLIAHVPCVALGGATLRAQSLVQPLADALARDGRKLAAASVIAAYRRAWIEQALERGDGLAVLDGLRWTTWSWIGRPLFADSFGEVVPAAHPHLLGLREVSSIDWYYNRQSGIPDIYQADALARVGDGQKPAGDKFHLYLSGAGGTGKSCFLRYVYEKLAQRPGALAVWYRVDAPTSGWPRVEDRIKEETVRAVASQLGDAGRSATPRTKLELSEFLLQLAANLRHATPPVTEIALFIDQLERTFESGDAPDPVNLGDISRAIVSLLKDLNAGRGVRVFIASRKQYLPDFLQSYHHAEQSRLHFNVLQTIDETAEQKKFVRSILEFCAQTGLVDENLRIEDAAAATLANHVAGHPLNLMLSLIQLFAEAPTGTITQQQLEARRPPPWENLFHFDLQLAAKDDLDWYFVLAMAAARTEIVRSEEVWWRLRLIDARLTRRADEIGPHGMLERLWLLGHLGRTIHARPDGNDPAGFLEFFHANLRDHLLRDVMGTGGVQLGIPGRSGGMPPVWRSLDRLAAAARDWTQTQQALPPDDVAVLMQHRDVVIKPFASEGLTGPAPFALLFLRDAPSARSGLCLAAAECFVFSALVHDQLGRWAFEALFPDIAKRTARCTHWLGRSDRGSRLRILRYLVELGAPGEDTLAEIALAPDVPEQPALWREVADVLAEPLFAARFRDRVVGACVERAAREPDGVTRCAARCRELIIAACDGSHGDIVTTLASLDDLAARSDDVRVKQLCRALAAEGPLQTGRRDAPSSVDIAASNPRDLDGEPTVPIQLIVHSASRAEAIERMVSGPARQELIRRLGIPLPAIAVRTGERVATASDPSVAESAVSDDAIELRLAGQSVALGVFPLDRCQVLQRHWQRSGRPPPAGPPSFNDALGEVVSWVDPAQLDARDASLPARRSDEAIIDWLEEHVRRHADLFFDFDLLVELMREIAARIELRRLFETLGLPELRRIVLDLVEERAPLFAHRFALIEKLQQLTGRIKDVDVLTQKLREAVAPALCRAFVGAGGELALITLSERLEDQLATRLRATATGDEIGVTTAQAQDIVNAIRRLRERCLSEHDVLPVVVTVPVLRRPLFELCRGFDRRIFTLSLTELSPKVRFLVTGEIPALAAVGDG